MKRRSFLAASAAGLALPSVARAQKQTTLKFIPQIDLAFLDPHWTTAYVTRNHGYLVFDTLYGQDGSYKGSPQMVEGHVVENEGKLWKLTLRDGMLWHDGERVLARDCVASVRRWARRDSLGDALMQATDELSAPDDKTIQFRLKRPFPLLPEALGKSPSPMPAMMPERLANTDPFTQIKEIIGSGPYMYKADERVQGSKNVYQRFEKYRPRDTGTPDWTAGPKRPWFDRIEWTTMPDASVASAALQNGEQDWWEYVTHDLIPLLKRNKQVKVSIQDPTGGVEMARPNHLTPPFNNPRIRQIVNAAIYQADFMQAIVGDDPSMYYTPLGYFCPKTPMASEVGLEMYTAKKNHAKIKAELAAAGYKGEKVVLMVAVDYPILKALGDVLADVLTKIGVNVDYIVTDWGTMLQRRAKKEPADQGGWNLFVTGWAGTDHLNPAGHIALRGNGDQPSSWPGWCTSPELERLRNAWFTAPDLAAQQAICVDMQKQALIDVPYMPLGQYQQPTAYRSDITGMLNGFATFWNVRRA
ncbi:MAG: ABC transporter substrate-binding protein [Acetobacteraceae bacterium]|nr:ABC transporter substrate-binding protein [Acetobacteraceae bacterium]